MNKYLRVVKRCIRQPSYLFFVWGTHGGFHSMDDRKYLTRMYKILFGTKPNFEAPKLFNEKINWMKLYDRKPEYTTMVDKYLVKGYVESIIKGIAVPVVGGPWTKSEDIDFEKLPDAFVLKCNHNSGGMIVCRDKTQLDVDWAKKKIDRWLREEIWWQGREWPYKDVSPLVFAETLLVDEEYEHLPVYKCWCFDGRVELIQTIQNDKQPNESIDTFTRNWTRVDMCQAYPQSEYPMKKPDNLTEIIECAEILSQNMHFIRVDLYCINGQLYFSEYTFYPDAGFAPFSPPEWDEKLGNLLKVENDAV